MAARQVSPVLGDMDAVWTRITERWKSVGPGIDNEMAVHGTAMVSFCDLCQLPLCSGTPRQNAANTLVRDGQNYIFCSEPCRWIFLREPLRYAGHREIVKRILAGEAPGNLPELLTEYFRLTPETWGKDICHGNYQWLRERE
jgi:toluene monooxygenase system protein A